ncbi:serine/threonine protein phosphatase [Sphingomonas sp. IBVSS2]|uniref:metallophosphoesterase family protein n=1 Tax=Sphingomonas sp. IBVSS2 TaxID=1985172 RepID=UPI000A2E6022|nr:metallophosphoesterase family protein [Sphingomonas sp. IBVSS2]OSZ68504.1 serine/threonine protein phosphatase [Sphingomonas sp. IBVSS2]
MFRKLFKPPGTPAGTIPSGQRIYAVGDIHGRLDLLDALLTRIDIDSQARPAAEEQVIFLGDLIDRGPQSAQVVERLIEVSKRRPVRFLLGNHEEVFLLAVAGDAEALRFFTRIGGKETILSYGITPEEYDALDYDELMEALQAAVPQEHIAFLNSFEDMICVGDYAFVHAGIRPEVPLDSQKVKDLRWIRRDFLDHTARLERVVVYGHTISEDVDWGPNRIGIDTGAYASNRLTALGLQEGERWLLQT